MKKPKELKPTMKNLQKVIDRVNEFGNATASLVSDRTVYFRKMEDGSCFKTTRLTAMMLDLYDQAIDIYMALGGDDNEEAEFMMMDCQNPYYTLEEYGSEQEELVVDSQSNPYN